MVINGVKITLVVCFTIILAFILHIAYCEYVDRYSIIYTSDNAVFIFDKKTTIMSRYANGTCQLIDTKLPNSGINRNNMTPQMPVFAGQQPMQQNQMPQQPIVQQNHQMQQPFHQPMSIMQQPR